jgi:hypothetical protein
MRGKMRIFIYATFIPLLLGCAPNRFLEAPSVRQIYADPNFYKNKNVCVVSYFNLSSRNSVYFSDSINVENSRGGSIILDNPHSVKLFRDGGAIPHQGPVKLCGTISFDRDCFSREKAINCVPRTIKMKRAEVYEK